jgi:pantetheine-phosphate adenylyltransferase
MDNKLVVCGGTFDHFHKGHEELLNRCLTSSRRVLIGITSDNYVKKSKSTAIEFEQIESFKNRKQSVLDFLNNKRFENFEILEINDLFGSTLSQELEIKVIVVSQESKKGAEIINQKRHELDLDPLEISIIPWITSEEGNHISSARIRNGEINRNGKVYVKKLWLDNDLKLTEDLRKEFQIPIGELVKDTDDLIGKRENLLFTVGDITTKNFNEKKIGQDLSVIDFNVARERKFFKFTELGFSGDETFLKVTNPAGYITSNLFRKLEEIIKTVLRKKTVLLVDGEEDLAVLPLILLSPLNGIIFYGQPPLRGQAGIRKVIVSEESKNKAYSLISKLKTV